MKGARTFSHKEVDRRIRRLVEACVARIEDDPKLLDHARQQVGRYSNASLRNEWERLLGLPWPQLRAVILEKSDEGDRLRQSVPFGGFLSDELRMQILKAPRQGSSSSTSFEPRVRLPMRRRFSFSGANRFWDRSKTSLKNCLFQSKRMCFQLQLQTRWI